MPNWFPWIFIGGIVFILLGWLGTRYKDREYRRVQTIQDFISGAIMIGFLGVLAPDLFPSTDTIMPLLSSGAQSVLMSDMGDEVVQVGPPRLQRRN
jgi:hypothetical protein